MSDWVLGAYSAPTDTDQDYVTLPDSMLGLHLKGHTIDVSQHVATRS